MTEETNQVQASGRISVDCKPELREAFTNWRQANGFGSDSEAIRDYMRKVTGFKAESQAQKVD